MALEQARAAEAVGQCVRREIRRDGCGWWTFPVCRWNSAAAPHVANTAEIVCSRSPAKAAWPQGIRRIEAVAGRACSALPQGPRAGGVRDLGERCQGPAGRDVERSERPAGGLKASNKALGARLRSELALAKAAPLVSEAEKTLGAFQLLVAASKGWRALGLQGAAQATEQQLGGRGRRVLLGGLA